MRKKEEDYVIFRDDTALISRSRLTEIFICTKANDVVENKAEYENIDNRNKSISPAFGCSSVARIH